MNTLHPDFAVSTQRAAGDAPRFSPEGSLLATLLDANASSQSVRIALPGNGDVVICPELRYFTSSAADMTAFCQAPAADFEISTPGGRELAAIETARTPHPIDELLWQAAFHVSQGRLLRDAGRDDLYPADLVSFTRWPNLSRLPYTPNTMRICALLTRNCSSIMLIPRRLGVTADEVYQVMSAAQASGIVHVLRSVPDVHEGEPGAAHTDSGVLRAMLQWLATR